MGDLEDIDERPGLFVGLTAENLARHVATYPGTQATPAPVASLLAEARRTFVGAAACYDNLASAAFKILQAAELALRVRVGKTDSRETLGRLVHSAGAAAVLSGSQAAWFRDVALHRSSRPEVRGGLRPGGSAAR